MLPLRDLLRELELEIVAGFSHERAPEALRAAAAEHGFPLRLFCDSILGPIEESEGAYGGELMRPLDAFIECNGQWERAANALFCHRHTLRYRIRAGGLTGRSLDSARDRIDFWLALRGRELVHIERN